MYICSLNNHSFHIYNNTFAGTCTFELDECTFYSSKEGDFEWLRSKGNTPSSYTGPAIDHTLGTAEGELCCP